MSVGALPAELEPNESSEWLEADGLGGFASGTTQGLNTRRYHALLLVAIDPPARRHVLVNDALVWLERDGQRTALSSHRYLPDVTRLAEPPPLRFRPEPWPCFETELSEVRVTREVIALHGLPLVLCSWRLNRPLPGARLCIRPLLSGRNFHALHHENSVCNLGAERDGGHVIFRPYASLPAVRVSSNATDFSPSPDWYRRFDYTAERERGLDHSEDLASPGVFSFDLQDPNAELILAADTAETRAFLQPRSANSAARDVRQRETSRRAAFATSLERAGAAYLVRRGSGQTILAGYPWFGDWGRDTFIALRGLCFATERWQSAAEILLAWAGSVSEGMLPNRFPDDSADAPEYNSVDAALWYVIDVCELLLARAGQIGQQDRATLERAAREIVEGHVRGTRHGIRVTEDGLLAAGAAGVQLTWMDSKIGDWVVTPRMGKPVEVQALWLNALHLLERLGQGQQKLLQRGLASFVERFDRGGDSLPDVVDDQHQPGVVDASFRPNQVFALGGLPLALLPAGRCRQILDRVEAELWTPVGLRSLTPKSPNYAPRYEGGSDARDSVYHQGTVWPWLLGPFIEAWVKCRGATPSTKDEAKRRFLEPAAAHLSRAGVGHISEIADGDAPHEPRGCPFQAWSVGEFLRVGRLLEL